MLDCLIVCLFNCLFACLFVCLFVCVLVFKSVFAFVVASLVFASCFCRHDCSCVCVYVVSVCFHWTVCSFLLLPSRFSSFFAGESFASSLPTAGLLANVVQTSLWPTLRRSQRRCLHNSCLDTFKRVGPTPVARLDTFWDQVRCETQVWSLANLLRKRK